MSEVRAYPDQYLLRMPQGLRDRIKAYADEQGTSMKREITKVLQRQFPEHAAPDDLSKSLRDYFAGQALNQATRDIWAEHKPEDVAKRAYQLADAMLAEREKGSGQ